MNSITRTSIEKGGGVSAVAKSLGISMQAVSKWEHVPAERVLEVERITGVSRYELRPDVFGAAPDCVCSTATVAHDQAEAA